MARTYKKKEASKLNGPKVETYLGCSHCDVATTLMLAPQDLRPQHRCAPRHINASFDIDVPATKAPKRPWFEERPKHPIPGGRDTRPRIVL